MMHFLMSTEMELWSRRCLGGFDDLTHLNEFLQKSTLLEVMHQFWQSTKCRSGPWERY